MLKIDIIKKLWTISQLKHDRLHQLILHRFCCNINPIINTLTMGWNKEEDAKLASLFRKGKKNGGASTSDLSTKHILPRSTGLSVQQIRKLTHFVPCFARKLEHSI